jgi:hypothetical protein
MQPNMEQYILRQSMQRFVFFLSPNRKLTGIKRTVKSKMTDCKVQRIKSKTVTYPAIHRNEQPKQQMHIHTRVYSHSKTSGLPTNKQTMHGYSQIWNNTYYVNQCSVSFFLSPDRKSTGIKRLVKSKMTDCKVQRIKSKTVT